MSLKDPVAVYNGANSVEVHMIQNLMVEAGVEAFATDDISQVLTGWLGPLTEMNKHQVWVEREDIDRAKPILEQYESQLAERIADEEEAAARAKPIDVTCEECGQQTAFPEPQRGSVQICPGCGAYVDVTVDDTPDEWRVTTGKPEGIREEWETGSTDETT